MSLENVQNYKQFIANRISRLYPTYWASVSFAFLLIISYGIFKNDFQNISFTQFLGNLTMFQFYMKIPDLDGPYWTMIIEMLFYITIVTLFHFKLLRYINSIFITFSLLVLISTNFAYDKIWIHICLYYMPLLQFLPLFHAGIIFYKLISTSEKKLNLLHYSMLLLCLLIQIFLFNYSGRTKAFIDNFEYAMMLTIYFTLFTLFVNNKLTFIINKPALFFGKISFALYLIHQNLSLGFIIPFLQNKFQFNFWLSAIIALFCSISVATIITYIFDTLYSKKIKEKLYKHIL